MRTSAGASMRLCRPCTKHFECATRGARSELGARFRENHVIHASNKHEYIHNIHLDSCIYRYVLGSSLQDCLDSSHTFRAAPTAVATTLRHHISDFKMKYFRSPCSNSMRRREARCHASGAQENLLLSNELHSMARPSASWKLKHRMALSHCC